MTRAAPARSTAMLATTTTHLADALGRLDASATEDDTRGL